MRSPWALCLFLVVMPGSSTPAIAEGETLRAVLVKAGIPTTDIADTELEREITSFAVSEQPDPPMLAYYVKGHDDYLNPPLHIVRYNAKQGVIRRSSIDEAQALFMHETRIGCLGSALSIHEAADKVLIKTHYNPSVACTLVLSKSLALENAISGWILKILDDRFLIIRDSMVHFSPTHPTRLSIYDTQLATLIPIYPVKNDAAHAAYSDELRRALRGSKGCFETGRICDETLFENDIVGQIAVSSDTPVFAFLARFLPDQFGERAERMVKPKDVIYVYRYQSGTWDHRSFSSADMRAKFKAASLDELVAGSASMVFETPRDAPKR